MKRKIPVVVPSPLAQKVLMESKFFLQMEYSGSAAEELQTLVPTSCRC